MGLGNLATKKRSKRALSKVGGPVTPITPQVPPVLVEMGRTVKLEIKRISRDEGVTYRLKDGSTVTMVPIITSVERSLSKYNATGEPIYQMQAGFLVKVDVAKRLKRKVRIK